MQNVIYILVLVISGTHNGLTATNSVAIEGYTSEAACLADLGVLLRTAGAAEEMEVQFAECAIAIR